MTPMASRPRNRNGTVGWFSQLSGGVTGSSGLSLPVYNTLATPPVAMVMAKKVQV